MLQEEKKKVEDKEEADDDKKIEETSPSKKTLNQGIKKLSILKTQSTDSELLQPNLP